MALIPTWWPSALETIELLAALALPVGMYLVVTEARAVRWSDLLVGVAVFIIPAVVILGIEGILPPTAGGLIIGIAMGHTMEMLDED